MEKIDLLKKQLAIPQKIVLIPHRNPDGDAVGSTLAMYHFLKSQQHQVTVVAPNKFPSFLAWMPGAETICFFDSETKKAKRKITEATLVFLLDFNALHRTGNDMQFFLEKYKGTFVMIDHHQQPDAIAAFTYSDTSICSTCQMVYHFIEKLEKVNLINKEIATCLYTGIMTDTGSFRFPSTTSTTHRIIADLIDKGANNARIHNNVYDTNSYSSLQLLGCALQNMKVVESFKTAYITLSIEELERYKYKKGDTEGIVNYALSLKGIIFAAIFIEDADQKIIKLSLRSKGTFSVNEFARAHFEGGGHTNAAGGKSQLSLAKTVENFLNLLPQYKQQLLLSYEI